MDGGSEEWGGVYVEAGCERIQGGGGEGCGCFRERRGTEEGGGVGVGNTFLGVMRDDDVMRREDDNNEL